jgi:hypothetical protein
MITDAIIAVLGTIVATLVAYIFISFRRDTVGRFSHQDHLIEQMVENNNHLSKLITDHDYRLRIIENKAKIKIGEYSNL